MAERSVQVQGVKNGSSSVDIVDIRARSGKRNVQRRERLEEENERVEGREILVRALGFGTREIGALVEEGESEKIVPYLWSRSPRAKTTFRQTKLMRHIMNLIMIATRLLFVYIMALLCSSMTVVSAATDSSKEHEQDPVVEQLLQACTEGQIDTLQALVQQHTSAVLQRRSAMGETCLHVAGIHGQAKLTSYVLEEEANGDDDNNNKMDPNVRSTFEHGLRMHPLSWNVYGGHVETARVLLTHGANVNLDVDDMSNPEKQATALDIVDTILEGIEGATKEGESRSEDEMGRLQRYRDMRELLIEFGAKRFEDL